jgi:hypothetical protein
MIIKIFSHASSFHTRSRKLNSFLAVIERSATFNFITDTLFFGLTGVYEHLPYISQELRLYNGKCFHIFLILTADRPSLALIFP